MNYTPSELQNEKWRVVKSDPEYMVSDLGRAMSRKYIKRHAANRNLVLKPQVLSSGYHQYRFYTDGVWTVEYASRLVWKTFRPDEPLKEYKMIRHYDQDISNNRLANLYQTTRSVNLMRSDWGDDQTERAIKMAIKLQSEGWTYTKIADLLGVSDATIWRWCKGVQKYLKEMQ